MAKEMTEAKARERLVKCEFGECGCGVGEMDSYCDEAKGILHGIKLGLNDEVVSGLKRSLAMIKKKYSMSEDIQQITDEALANYETRKKEVNDGS